MTKAQRELKDLAERSGLTVLDVDFTRGGHQKLTVQAPDGRTKVFSMSATASDFRTNERRKCDFRKFLRGIYQ